MVSAKPLPTILWFMWLGLSFLTVVLGFVALLLVPSSWFFYFTIPMHIERQTSTTDLCAKSGSGRSLVLLVSMGVAGDREINDVVANIEFLRSRFHSGRSKDVVTVFPFGPAKVRDISSIRGEPVETERKILESFGRAIRCEVNALGCSYTNLNIGLIGHRHKGQTADYFGAVDSDRFPLLVDSLLRDVAETPLRDVDSITISVYVCNAQQKIKELEDVLRERLQWFDKPITIKASEHEIIANPVYQNLVMELNPEFNKHKGKYLAGRAVPSEHRLAKSDLLSLGYLKKRVFAREIPKNFKARSVKSRGTLMEMSKLFTDRENHWQRIRVGKPDATGLGCPSL